MSLVKASMASSAEVEDEVWRLEESAATAAEEEEELLTDDDDSVEAEIEKKLFNSDEPLLFSRSVDVILYTVLFLADLLVNYVTKIVFLLLLSVFSSFSFFF